MLSNLQEVLNAPQVYDGKAADVWSCAVHLYIMLVGWYPFTDPREPQNFSKTASNITKGRFAFPKNLPISDECKLLIGRMFDRDPERRITIPEIQAHPWFRKNLSRELAVRFACFPGHWLVCN
jgi:serine/threonine-protein kinase SRK2